ncbi:MAG: translation initiation factor IF-2 subunit beta [Candidatus Norongarragalinales archaeon]
MDKKNAGDYDYEKLLNELYKALPERKSSSERFEPPVAELFFEGNKTTIRNYGEICSRLRRNPNELAKYLFKELAAKGTIEANGARLVLNARVTQRQVNEKLTYYIQSAVICKECGKPDTHIDIVQGVRTLVCEACGARKPVR